VGELVAGLAGRWRALERGARAALAGMVVLVGGAIAVRAWLVLGYGPAFLGFGDSHEYVSAALLGVFRDPQKPAGYPLFLSLAHLFSDRLAFTILLQHTLGVTTGVLLYKALRRTGAPPWLGLLPAAVVFFGGTGLLLEHSLLADSLFAFAQALGIYAAVRALREPGLRWALLAGLAVGASFWIKEVALSSAVLLPALLALYAPGAKRRRLRSAVCAAGAVALLIGGYLGVQALATGYWGLQRQSAWNLYGRVATFVDCAHFTAPAGTRSLCPSEAPAHRQSESFYQYGREAPAVARFGGPARAPGYANALLMSFSLAAIEQQPGAYAGAILHGLTFNISPRGGEGYTPEAVRESLLESQGTSSIQPTVARYYPHDRGYRSAPGAITALASYEEHTRVQGPLLVALLAAALLGIPLLPRRLRGAALLFTLTAILSVTLAEAANGYDARYAYPAFGPLAAGAALGAWGLAGALMRAVSRRTSASGGLTRSAPSRPSARPTAR